MFAVEIFRHCLCNPLILWCKIIAKRNSWVPTSKSDFGDCWKWPINVTIKDFISYFRTSACPIVYFPQRENDKLHKVVLKAFERVKLLWCILLKKLWAMHGLFSHFKSSRWSSSNSLCKELLWEHSSTNQDDWNSNSFFPPNLTLEGKKDKNIYFCYMSISGKLESEWTKHSC